MLKQISKQIDERLSLTPVFYIINKEGLHIFLSSSRAHGKIRSR